MDTLLSPDRKTKSRGRIIILEKKINACISVTDDAEPLPLTQRPQLVAGQRRSLQSELCRSASAVNAGRADERTDGPTGRPARLRPAGCDVTCCFSRVHWKAFLRTTDGSRFAERITRNVTLHKGISAVSGASRQVTRAHHYHVYYHQRRI